MTDFSDEFFPGRVSIDLGAVGDNIAAIQRFAGSAQLMAVIKAGAYGHGRVQVALTALKSGVRWLGVSQLSEALTLRQQLDRAGVNRDEAVVFTWLAAPEADYREALKADLQLSASSSTVLRRIAAGARAEGKRAKVHLKIDVGMSRAGATGADFPELVATAAELSPFIETIGVWSHLSQADDPRGPGARATGIQIAAFKEAVEVARAVGIDPEVRHLAATSGTIWHPESRMDMVRIGIGLYGLSPNPETATSAELGLRPVMEVTAPLVQVKRLEVGTGVSYGATWLTPEPTWVGLVPLGYADGIPRSASNRGPVAIRTNGGTVRTKIVGRICMDQFVINLGTGAEPVAEIGDQVVLFGSGEGEPTADEWAVTCETINYEIVTRISPTVPRTYHGGEQR